MPQRHDLVEISAPKLDQNGYLVADAFPTRTGVFKYVKADGTITRELRAPEEVFRPESLESLKHRPIIDEHPETGPADASNTGRLSVGHVGEQVVQVLAPDRGQSQSFDHLIDSSPPRAITHPTETALTD